MDDIRGFSRESFIGVTTNIESQEWRRRMNGELHGPENPRAGTSDNVENFISIAHRHLGNNFTLRDFKYGFDKLVR